MQSHTHLSFVIGDVEGACVIAFQAGERTQTSVGAIPILDESLFRHTTGSRDIGEGAIPIAALHICQKVGEGLIGSGRFGGVQSGALAHTNRNTRLSGYKQAQDHQCRGDCDENNWNSIFHARFLWPLRGTICCSRLSERTGTGTPRGTRRVLGRKNSRKIARKLIPIGSIPQSSPCQGAGIASDSILWEGGTSSLAQAVISPLPKVSIFRHPTKVSSGS